MSTLPFTLPTVFGQEAVAAPGSANLSPCLSWDYVCADFPSVPTVDEQIAIDAAVAAASEALWMRTKRQFGTCELTLRPCRQSCWSASAWTAWMGVWQNASGWGWPFPALVGGQWYNLGCGACGDACSCSVLHETRLPYPVNTVIEVKVDGGVLPPSAYRVDDYRLLVRLDGGSWPSCNDLNLDDTQVGTWSVTATYGYNVPQLGQLAVGQLASEIYKHCTGGKSCLPAATVKQVTRQGVTKVFFDDESAFKRGRIGLYYTDLFVATYNPSGTGLASIFDIDGTRPRRTNT